MNLLHIECYYIHKVDTVSRSHKFPVGPLVSEGVDDRRVSEDGGARRTQGYPKNRPKTRERPR